MNKILLIIYIITVSISRCHSQNTDSSSTLIIYPSIYEKGIHERSDTNIKSFALALLIDNNDKIYFTSINTHYLTEEGGTDHVYGFTYQHEYFWDHITFKLGGSIILTPYFPIPIPNLGTRIGWPDKFYIDINILDFEYIAFSSAFLKYQQTNLITMGYGALMLDENEFYNAINLDLTVFNIIKFSGLAAYDFNTKDNFLKLGIGVLIL
ncbi:MAG: hypothetical protein KDF60_18625 [Calditrichaeota bacterium]|nr:hypothetical protein [Calditrichota bacterium]